MTTKSKTPKPETKQLDLSDRLLEFTSNMLCLAGSLPEDRAGGFLAEKLLQSATAGYFSYGEAEGSPSAKEFAQKFRDALAHLRASRRALRLLEKTAIPCDGQAVRTGLEQVDMLIRIFFSSIRTLEGSAKS